jgi:hypothetical protein
MITFNTVDSLAITTDPRNITLIADELAKDYSVRTPNYWYAVSKTQYLMILTTLSSREDDLRVFEVRK